MSKTVATWLGAIAAAVAIAGTAVKSAADYGRLEGRVVAIEGNQRASDERLAKAIEKMGDELVRQGKQVSKICGSLPDCKE